MTTNSGQAVILALASVVAALACGAQSVAAAGNPATAPSTAPARRDAGTNERLGEIVEANIIATHAWQVLMAQKARKPDMDCYAAGELSAKDLEALVAHQQALVTADPAAIKAWAEGKASTFDRAKDLDPILKAPLKLSGSLPVSLAAEYLTAKATAAKAEPARADIRAVASLMQTVMEVNRDGELLQQQYEFYIALGLAAYQGQLGLGGSDADIGEMAWELSPKTCPSPFGTKVRDWKIAARKVWNWGEKKLHIRDGRVLAREILQEADIKELVPKIKAMKARRIAVIGHSFTIDNHWSSPSSGTQIAATIFEMENPAVQWRHFNAGGINAVAAKKMFLDKALEWKPDQVFILVIASSPADLAAMKEMADAFTTAGAKFTVIPYQDKAAMQKLAGECKLTVADFDAAFAASPERANFVCLDGVHMTESYHRIMAKELVKFLVK
ncbi:MAG: hypothetical protein ACE15C_09740 [Phycisphaerae bacterium]